MASGDDLVPDLAGAVIDGTAIDWAAAESNADDATRPVVAELKVLATLADVHRRCRDSADVSAANVDPDDPLTRWGHLRILERIGHGAFGEVYRAWDTRLDREVALKLIDVDRAGGNNPSSSIIQEGRLLARVRHANVATIYGAEQIGSGIGLWMEFVRGRTLKQITDAGRTFSASEVIHIGIDLCRAVAAVHSANVLHRDIKAQNVILADDGRPVLMDFGTGREVADNSTSDLTGTPLYVAPEILAGGEATMQSDIYSLGILLYYLVTGSYPVSGPSLRDVRQAHERNERQSIRSARARTKLTPRMASIIERATDPRPAARYDSADSLAADLVALRRQPALAWLPHAIGVGAGLLLVALMAWELLGSRAGLSETPGALLSHILGWNAVRSTGATLAQPPVIAVLPFNNLSAERDSDYFVDGLTDEIIRNLAVIRGLEVRSHTSSFAFKNKPRNLRDVGQQLGANLVVEGSVFRSGNQLRINAQLVQVDGDIPLWSESFNRELKDVFAIQDEISRAIVNRLRLTLGKGQRRYDTNEEAYVLYLKGRVLLGRGGIPDLERAADAFRAVIAKDPSFAPAHAGLANAYALMLTPSSSTFSFETGRSIVQTAAVTARDLDPLLADAHAAMGWVHSYDHDWANADKAFQRAIELNPSLTQTYTSYVFSTLEPLGRLDEALHYLRLGLRHDPFSLDVQRQIGEVQFVAGRYTEAIDTFERVRAADPNLPFVEVSLGRALLFAGRLTDALPVLERLDGRNLGRMKVPRARRAPWLAHAYVLAGRRGEAETLIAEHEGSPASQAIVYAALGNTNGAFEALEQIAVVQPHQVGRMLMFPEMAALRSDPRVRALRQRFGLPAE